VYKCSLLLLLLALVRLVLLLVRLRLLLLLDGDVAFRVIACRDSLNIASDSPSPLNLGLLALPTDDVQLVSRRAVASNRTEVGSARKRADDAVEASAS
jgi:hypothetical protein